jgi:STE24 endopeptidase
MRFWAVIMAGLATAMPSLADAASFDVDHATALYLAILSPAARARSDAYFDGGLWLNALSTLITILICWVILRSGVLVRVRDAMRRSGWRPWVIMMTLSALFLLCLTVLGLPWSIFVEFWRERRFGLMNQSFGGWLGDQAISTLLTVVLGALLLTVINRVMRMFPGRWWLVGAGVTGALIALLMLVSPVFIQPLFNSYSELAPGPLRARIEAMAAANHVPADHIVVYNASRQSDRISANVAGFGPTVRISLTDNLVNRTSLPEAAAVVGHEMGHYALHHVWRAIAGLTTMAALEFWLLARFGPAVVALSGRRRGLRGLDDPAALPVLTGGMALLLLLFSPLNNTLVRISESEADAFGLEASREPDGFALAAMKLASHRKIAPSPMEEALFFDHPSGATRVHMAMQWKKDHVPGAQEVTPPPLPVPKAP